MPKVYFHTFGCRTNQYETETIRAKLACAGYLPAKALEDADVCVVNSCSVTMEADKKCRQFLRRTLRENHEVRMIVTGCYATRAPEEICALSPRIELFSNDRKDSIPETLSGCSLLVSESPLLTEFSGHTRAFVKVQDGCDASCTYCIIPKLRPRMKSRPSQDIVEEVRGLVAHGYREIVLTGIRLGSYGLSSSGGRVGKNKGALVPLLKDLVRVRGNFRIRLSSLEITEVHDELLRLAASDEKICPSFHLPLQSGDDAVLKRMGRWYSGGLYVETVEKVRELLPDAGVTADVIVGFPGETDLNFANTVRVIESTVNGLHVFPYSPRPGTPALKLKERVDVQLARERARILLQVDRGLRREFQNRFAGTKRMVLVESDGGFTDNGIRVPVPKTAREGALAPVRIPSVP